MFSTLSFHMAPSIVNVVRFDFWVHGLVKTFLAIWNNPNKVDLVNFMQIGYRVNVRYTWKRGLSLACDVEKLCAVKNFLRRVLVEQADVHSSF